jgi:hypothetical protein
MNMDTWWKAIYKVYQNKESKYTRPTYLMSDVSFMGQMVVHNLISITLRKIHHCILWRKRKILQLMISVAILSNINVLNDKNVK